ncbi:MAG: hypothetical protein ACD_29C00107G0002 [uncultured bacterium]|nr:MAG: hypothetical protein ACD_29C00107G0002 [uncultured bacterium]
MNNQHTTLFISDLHLDPHEPNAIQNFFYFLKHIANQSSALYILGDFFEVYIGDDDDQSAWLTSIKTALKNVIQLGIPVYFMRGNRDFLIQKRFAKETGVILIPDPYLIRLNGEAILLTHGDSLCTLDVKHQRFRKIVGNKIVQRLFLLLPLSTRKNIAKKLRKKSTFSNVYKSQTIMDVVESAVFRQLKQYSANKIIHGHTHRPCIYSNRIVLGAWHEKGNYLALSHDAVALHDFEIQK